MFYLAMNCRFGYKELLDMEHDETIVWVDMVVEYNKVQNEKMQAKIGKK